jgi:hypothetical protein
MNATRHLSSATTLGRGLGWFSIVLGAAELLMPRQVGHAAGLGGREALVRMYGVREIATGLGLLASRRPVWWMWARVVGDALDAATLSRGRSRQAAAVAVVARSDYELPRDMQSRPRLRSAQCRARRHAGAQRAPGAALAAR